MKAGWGIYIVVEGKLHISIIHTQLILLHKYIYNTHIHKCLCVYIDTDICMYIDTATHIYINVYVCT